MSDVKMDVDPPPTSGLTNSNPSEAPGQNQHTQQPTGLQPPGFPQNQDQYQQHRQLPAMGFPPGQGMFYSHPTNQNHHQEQGLLPASGFQPLGFPYNQHQYHQQGHPPVTGFPPGLGSYYSQPGFPQNYHQYQQHGQPAAAGFPPGHGSSYSHPFFPQNQQQGQLPATGFPPTHTSPDAQQKTLQFLQENPELAVHLLNVFQSTHGLSNAQVNMPHIQRQNSQPATEQPDGVSPVGESAEMSVDDTDPHNGDPHSTTDGGNHEAINPVTEPRVDCIVTQPGKVQEKFSSHLEAFGLPVKQQDVYTDSAMTERVDCVAKSVDHEKRDDSTKPSDPLVDSEDIYTSGDGEAAGGAKTLVPRDSAKVVVRVELPGLTDKKKKHHLQVALQSWSCKHVGKSCEVNNIQLHERDPCLALVSISPPDAVKVLKGQQKVSLTFKDLKASSAEVHFLDMDPEIFSKSQQSVPKVKEEKNVSTPEEDMLITAIMDLDKLPLKTQTDLTKKFKDNHVEKKLSFSGSFETIEKNYREVCEIVGGSKSGMAAAPAIRNNPHGAEKSEDPAALTVPLVQYWYFSHIFRKELDQFKKKFGVEISAEVSVSVTPVDQTRSISVQEAAHKFTDFYLQNTKNLLSAEIPQTQLESDIVKHVKHRIHNDKAKMMLNLSGDQCLLLGTDPVISTVQKQLNQESDMEIGTSFSNGMTSKMETDFFVASSSRSSQISKPVEIVIKDAPYPIEMNETHWKLLEKTCQKQIWEIEMKYGVLFSAKPSQGSVKVTVTSNNQHVNLESHAHRAFMSLYQKVATSVVSCTLKRPADGKTVEQALESCQDCFVDVKEKNDTLKLVGLPKSLSLLIAEIEKLTRKPVFDDKTKELVGFPKNFPQSWGLRGGAGAAGWADRASPNSGAEAKYEPGKDVRDKEPDNKNEDDNCPICMDKFIKKKKLKCGHEFCEECLDQSVKNMGEICPVCKNIFGKLIGTQPRGTMNVSKRRTDLPGYPRCGTIEITYDIPSGIQMERHPNPGQQFFGAHRQAYLPDNNEGNDVLKLLQRAFEQRLIFTVGTSTTTGAQNSVIWNDIHHKTNTSGGPQNYGYPDDSYLKRVKEELKAKGIE